MTIMLPTGQHISPGVVTFHRRLIEVTECWMFGELIETKTVSDETFDMLLEEPEEGRRADFEFDGKTFIVIRDDDEDFWGPDGKEGFLAWTKKKNREDLEDLAERHGWEIDSSGAPMQPGKVFSIASLAAENKPLMAHIMVELGVFKSVGEAKRNGWDKPLEEGAFTVTKKKIRFRVVP